MDKSLRQLITLATFAGIIVAWVHIIKQFILFYGYEGTITKVTDCIIPNPVTTPCFYGGFGFILAFIIAIKLWRKDLSKKALTWFTLYLAAGTIFAWYNAGKDIINFYSPKAAGAVIGCSGVAISNPFTTACFAGASLFLLAFIFSLILVLRKK